MEIRHRLPSFLTLFLCNVFGAALMNYWPTDTVAFMLPVSDHEAPQAFATISNGHECGVAHLEERRYHRAGR
jgi:hypothetical protein